MADEKAVGAAGGAAQGAAAGAVFGPWGALIGGIIGGAIGAFGGQQKKLAKKYAKKAQEQRRQQQTMQLAIQRRDTVRQQRMARSQAVAAGASDPGVSSTSISGATASVDSQGASALAFFDSQVGLDNLFQQYNAKAGKYAAKGEAADSILGAATSMASIGGDVYGMANKPPGGTSPYSSFNTTAATSNMQNNSGFTTFGSSLNLGP